MQWLLHFVTALAFAWVSSRAATSIITVPSPNVVMNPSITNGNAHPGTHGFMDALKGTQKFDLEGGFQPVSEVNVLAYGATTNSSGNNTTFFDLAEAALPASGGILRVPRGTYRFTSAWTLSKSNIEIIGEKGTQFIYEPASETVTFIVLSADGGKISGIDFNGNGKCVSTVWLDNGSDDWLIEGNTIRGAMANDVNDPGQTAQAAGLSIRRGCDRIIVQNNIFTANAHVTAGTRSSGSIGVNDFGYTTSADRITGIKIIGNYFPDVGGGAAESDHIRQNTEYDGDAYDVGFLVQANHFAGWEKRGLKFIGNGGAVLGNYFNSTGSNPYSAVSFYGRNWVCDGNTFVGFYPDKIVEVGAPSVSPAPVRNITVSDMTVEATGASAARAIRLASSAQDITINGVRGEGVDYGVMGDGKIYNVQILNIGFTNVSASVVELLSDGTNSPANIQLDNVFGVGVASDIVRVSAGTNIVIGAVSGDAAGLLVNVSSGVTASVTGGLNLGGFATPTSISGTEILWGKGNTFEKTTSGNITFTFSGARAGQWITVKVTAGGAHTVTWPTVSWKEASVPSQTASQTDFYTFYFDGTTYFGSAAQNF